MRDTPLNIELNRENQSIAIYQQLADAIEEKILSGIFRSGMALPSTRKMAEQLMVSRKTVLAAMDMLLTKGLVSSKDRSGLFVNTLSPKYCKCKVNIRCDDDVVSPYCPDKIVVNDGYPDSQLLPFKEFSRCYRKLFNRAAQWQNLGYNYPMGYDRFRKILIEILGHSRDLLATESELCIVRGAQMALFLVANAVLQRGDHIALEYPGYHRSYVTFEKAGVKIHSIPVDEEGLDTNALQEWCEKEHIKAVYLTPRHQYPTTVALSMKRRNHLCQLAHQYHLIIMEDDFGAEFQFSGKHLLPLSAMLDKEHYIYIGTFSKIFVPAIRVGYIHSSESIIQKIVDYRTLIDIQGDIIAEHALCELYEFGDMQKHIRKTMRIYKEKLEYISSELEKHLFPKIIKSLMGVSCIALF